MKGLINFHAIAALWRRQLGHLLLNPLGYVFILAFVVVTVGFLLLPNAYFKRNIADLGTLVEYMPWFLVVLLPTIAMGSWASERELGTEEQLLTLPLTVSDVLVGKWLGVVSFFTLALVCALSNLVVLRWLGQPDGGLIAAQYMGWWCFGLVLAAFSVLASTLVSLPAIGFVLGVLFSAVLMLGAWRLDWFDPFNRGLIPFGRVLSALCAAAAGLGLAVLILSARRWHPTERALQVQRTVVFAALIVTFVNFGVLADRAALDWDVTGEKLSSLSPATVKVIEELPEQVTITSFISQELPPELALKGREVDQFLRVVERRYGDKVKIERHQPASVLDEEAVLASQQYGLKPHEVEVDTVTGRELAQVFLAAVVGCGAQTQRIDNFDSGLSVEYELARAIRTVGNAKKKVLGIVNTDLKFMGGFDYRTNQMRPDWEVVEEWRKQYEVRGVDLETPVGDDINVLVVPQPSTLSEEHLERLHDYIWAGRPALILEDPLPLSDPQLGTAQPKKQQQQNPYGMPPPAGEKTDVQPLLKALGLQYEGDQVVWSDFNPSHRLRRRWPPAIVWCFRSGESMSSADVTQGVDSLLFPWPGMVRERPGNDADLKVIPLVRPMKGAPWGHQPYSEFFDFNPFFGMRMIEPRHYTEDRDPPGCLAMEVTGKMRRAYNFPEEKKDEEKKEGEKKDEKKEPPKEPKGLGQLSAKDVHVIFIADTDLALNVLFTFYRGVQGDELPKEDRILLEDLRNVQFLANAVDTLAGDTDFLQLRSRRAQRRPLQKLEDALSSEQKAVRDTEAKAQEQAKNKIAELEAAFQKDLAKIDKRPDLDDSAKAQLKESTQRTARAELNEKIDRINREADQEVVKAKAKRQEAFEHILRRVRLWALGVPVLVLASLALVVFAHRLLGERQIVPASRQRS